MEIIYILIKQKDKKTNIGGGVSGDGYIGPPKFKIKNPFPNIKKNINIVECGVGAGESLSYLSLVTQIMKINKKIWAFDSFEGFPEFTEEDVGKYQKGRNKTIYKN